MSISNIIDLALIMRNLEAIGYSEEQASAIYGNYTTLAVPMLNLAIALISPICISFMPTLTKARVLSNNELFKEVEKSAMETVSLISAPITVGLIFYSKEVLTLIYRNSDIEMGSMLLIILSPSIIFASILSVVNSILESSGFVKAPMVSMLFGGFAKLIVSYFLIKNPLIGISGAPIGTVVSYSVALIVSLVIYEKRLGGFPKTLSLCVKPYLIALITVSVSMFLYNIGLHFINPKISFIIIIVFTSILYLSASLLTGILSKKKVEKMAKYTNFAT